MATKLAGGSPINAPGARPDLAAAGLSAMLASGKLGMRSYFRACVLSGVTFASAVRGARHLEAWAKAYPEPGLAMTAAYRDFVGFDL